MNILRKLTKTFLFIIVSIIALGIYIWRIEPRWVEWNKMDMTIENLPSHLEGKTLVQLSDIHIGQTVEEEYILKQFDAVNDLKPDILVYTGDFISAVRIDQAPYDQLKTILKRGPKGKLGTIAILGNHDYGILARNGPRTDSVVQLLETNGITVLRNNAMEINGLNIIGIDDYWGTNFYPQTALGSINKKKANLVLVHNPDVCDLNIWNGYTGWILSGHTHGGQFRLPFRKASILPVQNKNYDEGIKKLSDGRTLYINKGLGHAIRVRFNVRPEIAVFTIKQKAS